MVQVELTACRLLKAPQSTQPKKPQRGGPVAQGPDVHPTQEASGRGEGPDAQDQSSTQPKNRGGPDAPGPVVHPTKEPQGQSLRGELRSARCTTSTPPHNHKSVTGPGQVSSCGWFFGGSRRRCVVDQ